MSKSLGAVLNTLYGPVSGFVINGKEGFSQGVTNAVMAYRGPYAYGAYVAGAAIGGLAKSARSEQTETSIKTPIPPKMSGYGTSRPYLAVELYR
jgi:hypothetical protein